jgi:hypothetical protein
LPHAVTDMMQLHLDEISRNATEGAHAVLLLDRAGWHTTNKLDVPDNITPIFLPSRAPELNPVENVRQYLRQNLLSNTVFENYDAIIDATCAAWLNLTAEPEPSRQSDCETGRTSVSRYDLWYNDRMMYFNPSPTGWRTTAIFAHFRRGDAGRAEGNLADRPAGPLHSCGRQAGGLRHFRQLPYRSQARGDHGRRGDDGHSPG